MCRSALLPKNFCSEHRVSQSSLLIGITYSVFFSQLFSGAIAHTGHTRMMVSERWIRALYAKLSRPFDLRTCGDPPADYSKSASQQILLWLRDINDHSSGYLSNRGFDEKKALICGLEQKPKFRPVFDVSEDRQQWDGAHIGAGVVTQHNQYLFCARYSRAYKRCRTVATRQEDLLGRT